MSMLNDAQVLGLGLATKVTLTGIYRHLQTAPDRVSRSNYESARAVLFRALDAADPSLQACMGLSPDGGFKQLSPIVALFEDQPIAKGYEALTIFAPIPAIGPDEIAAAHQHLSLGVPPGLALGDLIERLERAGNGPGAIAAWLRRVGGFKAAELGWAKLCGARVATILRNRRRRAAASQTP